MKVVQAGRVVRGAGVGRAGADHGAEARGRRQRRAQAHGHVVGRLDVDLLQRLIEPAVAAVKILRDRFAPIVGQLAQRRGELGHHRLSGAGAADRPRREVRDRVPELRHREPPQRRDRRLRGGVAREVHRRRRHARRAARARTAAVAGPRADAIARTRDARPPTVARPRRVPGARRTASRAARVGADRPRTAAAGQEQREVWPTGAHPAEYDPRPLANGPGYERDTRRRPTTAQACGITDEKTAPFTPGARGSAGVWRKARR